MQSIQMTTAAQSRANARERDSLEVAENSPKAILSLPIWALAVSHFLRSSDTILPLVAPHR
jgi:hypothetical protein